jgi:hypothetical protein
MVMDTSVPTVELPNFPGQHSWEIKTESQPNRFDAASLERRRASLSEAKDIARAEMARRRRRLGTLTLEQEIEVEHLLMLTVTKVSELAGRVLDSLPVMP